MSDPLCGGLAWRVLATAAPAWNVQVYVPEVVIIEAIAGYERRVAEAAVGLTRWADKHVGPLGLAEAYQISDRALVEAASSYAGRLRESLQDLNAVVVKPPEVTHTALVERAASRRRPCDDHGDGYRDTLNWLTVLSLASEYPDDQITWVSDNTHDFGKDNSSELHEDLVAELVATGVDKRVRWLRTLPDLVLTLAAEHAPEAPADLTAIQDRLRAEALSAYIEAEILAATVGKSVDPRRCGLPTATTSAKILAVGVPNEFRLTVRGALTDNETVVEFDLEAETSIQISLLPGFTTDDSSSAAPIETASIAQDSKPLKFSGFITLDRYDRPIGGELTRITAKDDDPGLAQWAILDAHDFFPWVKLSPDMLKVLSQRPIVPSASVLKLFGQQVPSAAFSKLLGQQVPSASVLKLFGQQVPSASVLKLFGQQVPSASVLKLFGQQVPSASVLKLFGQQVPSAAFSKLLGQQVPSAAMPPSEQVPEELDPEPTASNDSGDQGSPRPEPDDDDNS